MLVVLVSLALLLGGCTSDSMPTTPGPATTEPIHIKVGTTPILSNVVLYIAEKNGYFAKEGLSVELVPFQSNRDFVALLLNGQLDVAQPALSPGFFNAVGAGGKLKMVLAVTNVKVRNCSYIAFFVRRADMETGIYREPGNWKGARVALLPAGAQSATGYIMDHFLRQGGLGLRDINLPVIDLAIQPEALRVGQVDIVLASEPWVTRMKADSNLAQLLPAESYAPNLTLSAILYGSKLLDNPDAGNRFAVAYLKAVRQYLQGAIPRNVEIITGLTGLEPEMIEHICLPDIPADGRINTDSVMDYQAWLMEQKFLDRMVSPDEFIDIRFVDAAHRVLGGNGQ